MTVERECRPRVACSNSCLVGASSCILIFNAVHHREAFPAYLCWIKKSWMVDDGYWVLNQFNLAASRIGCMLYYILHSLWGSGPTRENLSALIYILLKTGIFSLLLKVVSLNRSSIPFIIQWQTANWTSYTQTLTIHALNNISFPYIWHDWDSCQSSNCIRQNSKQKLDRSSDIPLNIAPVESGEGVKVTSSGINIIWNDMHRVLN